MSLTSHQQVKFTKLRVAEEWLFDAYNEGDVEPEYLYMSEMDALMLYDTEDLSTIFNIERFDNNMVKLFPKREEGFAC
tara:strand:- start:780 stop:1013 length:234 start_codon:yes stop_codon:yes gene_type:complete